MTLTAEHMHPRFLAERAERERPVLALPMRALHIQGDDGAFDEWCSRVELR